MPSRSNKHVRGFLFASVLAAAAAAAPTSAASPDLTSTFTYGACNWGGRSEVTGASYGVSETDWRSGNCYGNTFEVHAYFWGSDSQYHYMEQTAALGAYVYFNYWTNDVYGYHHYPGPGSNEPSTHAYTY